MKKLLNPSLFAILVVCFISFSTFAQEPPPGPCSFSETETLCFTNNSGKTEFGGNLTSGCDYQVCVTITPKPSCEMNCEMLLSPEGYYIRQCYTLAVGELFCFSMPTPSHPIDNCFDVNVQGKVLGHSQSYSISLHGLETGYGLYEDDCFGQSQDWTVFKKIPGSGTYNYGIFLRRYTGM